MKLIFLSIALFLSASSHSQSISREQWKLLHTRMSIFVFRQFPECRITKASEMAYLVLQTDTSGRISSIDVKGDSGDSIYQFLKRMPVDLFKDLRNESCINKVIVIPYFYWFFESNDSYPVRVFNEYYSKIPAYEITRESGNIVMTRAMVNFAPIVSDTECNPTPFAYARDSLPRR